MENNTNLYSSDYDFDWLKFAARLAVLDIFIPQILQNAFSNTVINNLAEKGKNFIFILQFEVISVT